MAELNYIARRALAPGHAARYFKELNSTTDINTPAPGEVIDPKGSPAVNDAAITLAERRLNLRLSRLLEVEALVMSPAFLLLEQNAMDTVTNIEQEFIWAALDKQDDAEVQRLRGERAGLIGFFQLYDPIRNQIAEVRADLAKCKEWRDIYVKGIEQPTNQKEPVNL